MNRYSALLLLAASLSSLPLTGVAQNSSTPVKKEPPQTNTSPPASPAKKPAEAVGSTETKSEPQLVIAPNAPVITLTGMCDATAPATKCVKTVSKAEFDKLVAAFAPNAPSSARRKMAQEYVRLLAMANQGEKLGADKNPAFDQQMQSLKLRLEEQLQLERLNLLAQAAAEKLKDSVKPTQHDVETYYAENSSQFEELQLRRIFIPKSSSAESKPETSKDLAEKIRLRAVAGEDLDKLETEAYLATKAPGTPPSTNMGWKRQGSIDPRWQSQISALKPAGVSEVIEDPQGYSIYKVDSKRTVPLPTAAKDIEGRLQAQRLQEKVQEVTNSAKADLNEAYFGPPEQSPQAPQIPTTRPAAPKGESPKK